MDLIEDDVRPVIVDWYHETVGWAWRESPRDVYSCAADDVVSSTVVISIATEFLVLVLAGPSNSMFLIMWQFFDKGKMRDKKGHR